MSFITLLRTIGCVISCLFQQIVCFCQIWQILSENVKMAGKKVKGKEKFHPAGLGHLYFGNLNLFRILVRP